MIMMIIDNILKSDVLANLSVYMITLMMSARRSMRRHCSRMMMSTKASLSLETETMWPGGARPRLARRAWQS